MPIIVTAFLLGLIPRVSLYSAYACPVCGTSTGQRVRERLFGNDFGYNLTATLIPFPLFLGGVAWIYYGDFPPRAPRIGQQGDKKESV